MTSTDFATLERLLTSDRSIRRFDASARVDRDTLEKAVALTRMCASGRNAQPLKYKIVTDPETCSAIFPALAWAGYYKDWDGPAPSERPTAYIIQCLDTEIANDCLCDDGLQLQAITLGLTALGLGGCIIKAFDSRKIADAARLPAHLLPRYVYATGTPAEHATIVPLPENGDFRYFRNADDHQCVPKRPLDQIIID